MTITIEQLETKQAELATEQTELAKQIAKFKAQNTIAQVIALPEARIELREGEHYAGFLVGKDGVAGHHVILLPEQAEDIKWADAVKWAAEQGGELPTRREQALLFANLKEQFKAAWYWSSETHASDSNCAWIQGFDNGYQNYYDKTNEFRARAVRRLAI
ncbi:DUF1566 domain-containing protein [Chitinibacter bivalviorum]|uniref:DUF1566 domain-containing protein n=1 Tax=Chitinibacter bivalviorum TaxID=2739434 RepID=A0A7H9BHJ7_9NEIS|nr:DUF1566 domain-containing protein [Chitinibacter bivalviorum]QLG87678.1 DUF1566 domain-containing protein [Chitinibacter bivalviorum]